MGPPTICIERIQIYVKNINFTIFILEKVQL